MTTQGNRIPSLDGMRAFSITLVIVSHIAIRHPIPALWRVDIGNLGVRTFFVISGFLITTLLIRERHRSGAISLSNFYLRRLFRIAPAYLLFLLAMALLIPTGLIMLQARDFLPALGSYANYKQPPAILGHTWSLSVEEQFYLVWAGALALFGLRRSLYGCVALLLIAPAFRLMADVHLWPTNPRYAFEAVSDALAMGCALALLREHLWARRSYRRLVESPYVVTIPLAALAAMAALPLSAPIRDLIGIPVLNLGIAVWLDKCTRYPAGWPGRILNWPPVIWVGTISYSLYLWQQPWLLAGAPPWFGLTGMFGCAAASYYWIERPCLALGRRFSVTESLMRARASHIARDTGRRIASK